MEPPSKRSKMENGITEALDNYIKTLKECTNLKAVLSDELEQPLPTIKVYVGQVKETKCISRAISILNEKIPLKILNHLKRVRKLDIILCPSEYLNNSSSIQEYLELNVPEIKDIFNYFKEIDVPAVAPKLKKQLTTMWSFNFHPDKYLERLTSNEFFNSKEMAHHINYMHLCFEVAKFHLRTDTGLKSEDFLQHVNATVIVDPAINSVVAAAFCNKDHPLQHSNMLAIDNVAKTQFGGAWGESSQNVLNCCLKGIDETLLKHLKDISFQARFGARTFIKKNQVNNEKIDEETTDMTVNSNQDLNNEDWKSISVSTGQKTGQKGPYLCTDYSVYTLKEPCIMCSMALVHARAKRIFYCFDNLQAGGLKSRTKLQCIASLNHHFEVFTGFLNC